MSYEKFLSAAIRWLKDRLGERSTRIGLAAAACGVVMTVYAMSRGEDSSALVGIFMAVFGIVSAATPDGGKDA